MGGMAACIVRGEVECPRIPMPVASVSGTWWSPSSSILPRGKPLFVDT